MEQNTNDYDSCIMKERCAKEREVYKQYIAKIHEHAKQGPHAIPKVDTNLEFWIGQEISSDELSTLTKCPWFRYGPGVDYIGRNYSLINQHDRLYMPDKYVSYSVQDARVVSIAIRDPDVHVWGVSMRSSQEEISKAMINNGFVAVERYSSLDDIIEVVWVLGTIHVRFYEDGISISTYKIGEENILY